VPVRERCEFYDAVAEEFDPADEARGAWVQGEGEGEDEGEAGREAAEEGAEGVQEGEEGVRVGG